VILMLRTEILPTPSAAHNGGTNGVPGQQIWVTIIVEVVPKEGGSLLWLNSKLGAGKDCGATHWNIGHLEVLNWLNSTFSIECWF